MTLRAIDLFCGWGGFSVGAAMADVHTVWAADILPVALEAHKLNHPEAEHVCQDLRETDWSKLPSYDIMLASPPCQGHSNAGRVGRKQAKAVVDLHEAHKSCGWVVVDCAKATSPQSIIIENVKQMLKWPEFEEWRKALEDLGYRVTNNVLTATDFDVPQKRTRLFVVANKGKSVPVMNPGTPAPPFGPCIDWDEGSWKPISAVGPDHRSRCLIANERFGRAMVNQVTGHKGLALTEPLRTITTQDQWGLVDHGMYRTLTARETARGMGFPESYRFPEGVSRTATIEGLGNAVAPPVVAEILRQIKKVNGPEQS